MGDFSWVSGGSCLQTDRNGTRYPASAFLLWQKFSCKTEKNPSSALEEGLEILSRGRGEEKGICKAALKVFVSAGNSSPPLGLAFWQLWASPGTAGKNWPEAGAEHPKAQMFDPVSLQLGNPSSV